MNERNPLGKKMIRGSIGITTAACAARIVSPVAEADRVKPPPIYGYYSASVDFAKQTFNGMPTPMDSVH